jgi:hypothetical protein
MFCRKCGSTLAVNVRLDSGTETNVMECPVCRLHTEKISQEMGPAVWSSRAEVWRLLNGGLGL